MTQMTRARASLLLATVAVAGFLGITGAAQQNPATGAAPAGRPAPRAAAAAGPIRSLHVQGNVWMINGGSVNAAVQIGDDGVLVVDTLPEPMADALLAEIRRLAPNKTIRYVLNTHGHPDHTGGNLKIAGAGKSIVGGNFAGQVGAAAADSAQIFAHENVQARMAQPDNGAAPPPFGMWPTDTFIEAQKDFYFNGEPIEMLHQPDAHTDGDSIVYFRKSDVIVAGDVYINTTFPVIDVQHGGNLNGIVKALNNIIRITVPKEKQEGGTYVIPGHGHLADEADVVEYRDMLTILHDRFADAVKRGLTLEQVKSAKLVRDYEGRYGATQRAEGAATTDSFVEATYRSLNARQGTTSRR